MKLRNIKYIVVHCTATPTNTDLESIKQLWKIQFGWTETPGYHYLIKRDGSIVKLLAEKKNSSTLHENNPESINLAYIGGIDKEGKPIDNRSEAQRHGMFDMIVQLIERYPKAEVVGLCDLTNYLTVNPCFDVKQWLRNYEPNLNQAA